MRIARAVLLALTVAALVPTAGAAQQQPVAVPELRAQGADDPLLQSNFGTVTFTVDRETYAAVFELARDGRVRVLYPARPSDTARVQPNRRYATRAWSPDMLMLPAVSLLSSLSEPVPFAFIVTSDRPLNLSAFGTGRRWARQLLPQNPDARPEAVIASIVDRVVADRAGYDWDYAYVAPRLTAQQQIVLLQCTSPSSFRHDDFWAYQSLWGLATTGWFRYPRAGLFFTTYYSPAFGAPSYWFETLGSCYTGPRLPLYVVEPRVERRVALASPTPPAVAPPPDTAHTPIPTPGGPGGPGAPQPPGAAPQRPLNVVPNRPGSEAPIQTGDWKEGATVASRPLPAREGVVPGGQQPKDPLPPASERLAEWKAERLARPPANADAAAADRAEQIARTIRAFGLTQSQAAALVTRTSYGPSERGRPGIDVSESRSAVVERGPQTAPLADKSTSAGTATSVARSAERSDAPRSVAEPRTQGPTASSAAQANAPGRATGDVQRRVQ